MAISRQREAMISISDWSKKITACGRASQTELALRYVMRCRQSGLPGEVSKGFLSRLFVRNVLDALCTKLT
eukprot:6133261-Amphidinium_carterae.1